VRDIGKLLKERCFAVKTSDFEQRNADMIEKMVRDAKLRKLSKEWFATSLAFEYHYHFTWLGLPIIQFPQDIVAMQEVVWKVKPDLIIETGIARGGSLIFYSSMLEIIGGDGRVLGIDIDIRNANRINIESHPMFKRITLIEGSSVDMKTFQRVKEEAKDRKNIMVALDSMHTHEHVLEELRLYSLLVSKGSYLIVFDTVIEDIPDEINKNRPWGKNNNPRSAMRVFLEENDRFIIDKTIERKLLITVAPDGFLKRI
jgi:cephalosporin hydroxylase